MFFNKNLKKMNPKTVKILSGLLELLEETIYELEKDIKNNRTCLNISKYNSLVKKYYKISNLKNE